MRTLLLSLAALLFVAPLLFGADLPSGDEAWLKRSLDIMRNPQATLGEYAPPAPKPSVSERDEAVDISQKARELVLSQFDKKAKVMGQEMIEEKPREEIAILITFGDPMNSEKVRLLMKALAGEDVTLAVRGLPVGMERIDQVVDLIGELGRGMEEAPGLVIDPRMFEESRVELSPTIMVLRDDEPVVWANGVTDPEWIKEKLKEGRKGDLGKYGEVEKVAEKSLNQEIAERIAKVDWESKKKEAGKRFWKDRDFLDFPAATRERAFDFTLEYEIKEDVLGAKGEILARAGDKINPVARIAGTFFLVVFDATDPLQIVTAKRLGEGAPKGKRVKYLATRIDPGEDGWEEKTRIENLLDESLFLIDKQQAKTLRITNVPATVQANGDRLRVMEYPPKR